jgi:hypothetical protein
MIPDTCVAGGALWEAAAMVFLAVMSAAMVTWGEKGKWPVPPHHKSWSIYKNV